MPSETVLFDLPSKPPTKCWSLNPWKARASLNYKGLPYRTEWVEYPDLKPTFSKLDIPKNDGTTSNFDYSAPAAQLPDGSYVMDSLKIAEALDKIQPEPSLHTDRKDLIDRAQAAVSGTLGGLRPIGMPRVPEMLPPRSAEYFHQTRSKSFGMSLEELGNSDKAGEAAWTAAEPHMLELRKILNEDKGGPFVLGSEVSFADFVIAGLWAFVKLLDRGDLYDRGMEFNASFPAHVKATSKWLERDDH